MIEIPEAAQELLVALDARGVEANHVVTFRGGQVESESVAVEWGNPDEFLSIVGDFDGTGRTQWALYPVTEGETDEEPASTWPAATPDITGQLVTAVERWVALSAED